MCLALTVDIRELLAGDSGFRPSFLGHILVEILLDAALIAARISAGSTLLRGAGALDPAAGQRAVHRMTTGASADAWRVDPAVLSPSGSCTTTWTMANCCHG